MLPTRRATRTTPATTTTPTTTVTNAQLQALIDQGVAAALAERDASRSRDGDNSHGSGTGGRRQVPTQRECTYTDFLKCQPINFKGTEGVVGLTQWAEKMESVFLISNCAITSQVKFASCTLQGSALTWWNSHVRAVGQDVAYTMPWTALKRMITDKYCPRGEIKKLESEYWNPKGAGYKKLRRKLQTICTKSNYHPRWAMYSKSALTAKILSHQPCLVDARSLQDNCPKLKNGKQGNRAWKWQCGSEELMLNEICGRQSKENNVEEVPIVQDFPEYFPILVGIPTNSPSEFQIRFENHRGCSAVALSPMTGSIRD
ncbi:hypothetical protein Tco_0521758 [Tanacetum coccineum]